MPVILARLLAALVLPRLRRAAGPIAGALLLGALLLMFGVLSLVGSTAGASPETLVGCNHTPQPVTGEMPGIDADMRTNATTIIATGRQLAVPAYGWVVALATALGESGLHNLPYGDRDSLGLFQQRPSQGWGTPEQILDPTYAATKFYAALLAVPGWEDLPVTVAAQSVQHSAFPTGYARHEALARQLVTDLGATATTASCLAGGPVVMLGDSITVGATPELQRLIPGIDTDAAVGRRLDQGDELLEHHHIAGATLVIAMCTNYGGDQAAFTALLDHTMTLAAAASSVVWVTCTEWSSAQPAANAAIREAQSRYPNIVVAEWADLSRAAGYLGPDGIHPTAPGAHAFAQVIADAIPASTPTVDGAGYALPLPARFVTPPLAEHHDGQPAVDLPAPTGIPVFAVTGGTVVYTSEGNGCGHGLVVTDPTGAAWTYCHMSQILIPDGATLTTGQQLGQVGSTGDSTGPHLHLEIHDSTGRPRCPQPFLDALAGGQSVPALTVLPTTGPCVPVPLEPSR